MPSLIDMRRRIRSVKNTQQLTKALKMVSAAKLRRAHDRVIAARPYTALLRDVLADLSAAARNSDSADASALLAERPEQRIQFIFITSDMGKAGAFNSNLFKGSQHFLEEHASASTELILVGRKGRDFYRKKQVPITAEHVNILNKMNIENARQIGRLVIERYRKAEIDAVYILNNEFKSMLSQKLMLTKLLPMQLPEQSETKDYILEQPALEMVEHLLPRYVESEIFRAMLETVAAEHAARMTAMDSASSNAADLIERLTLYMNRVRQASITKEIIEVVSGAAAAG